jgi:ribonuclease R
MPPADIGELTELGKHCTYTESRAEDAERELRDVLILQYLEDHVGDEFEGVITGVTNFGLFVQSPQFLVEGLLRLEDLGDDWWEVDAKTGRVRGEVTGRTLKLGDLLEVRIANVDVARRQMSLVPVKPTKKDKGKGKGKKKGKRRKGPSRRHTRKRH